MSGPPATERREVVETRHGEEIRDPYRWLEDDGDDVAAWVERQNEYADDHLHGDVRERLRPRMEARAEVPEYGSVVPRERGYFQRVEAEEDDRAKLLFRPDLDADPTVLADPNEWDEGESLDWFVPSPDGSLVAYGVGESGEENYDVTVLDVESGDVAETLRDCGRTNSGTVAWTDDGFYYVETGSAAEGGQLDKRVRYHELGSDRTDDPVLLDDVGERVWPNLETDDGTLVVGLREGWTDSEIFRWEGSPESGELVPFVTGTDSLFTPTLADGTVYLRTNYDAPKSRIVASDLDARDVDPDDLREVVPEREGNLDNFVLAGESIVTHHQRDAHSSLSVYDAASESETSHGADDEPRSDGEIEPRHEVEVPEYATVGSASLTGHPDAPEFFFRGQTFDRPPWVSRGDATTGETETVVERSARHASESGGDDEESESGDSGEDLDLVVEQQFFTSADGTEVPAFVVHREGLDRDGDNPTVLYGYGGFRISLTPSYDRFRTPFFEDGGVYVQANLRGGTEYGEEWHRAGMKEDKQNVFDDFFAVAEGLVEADYTRPERLAAMGGSNGGLLVGAAITQRPDLFGAACCGVPLLDMLRFHEFLLGESWTSEYGSPDDPEAFEYLREYSPYHNVEERDYPAVLFETAEGDTRVHPGHARKMTARMQAANRGENPVLLRTKTDTGHGIGKPTSMRVEEQLDQWAFLYDQLDVLE